MSNPLTFSCPTTASTGQAEWYSANDWQLLKGMTCNVQASWSDGTYAIILP
ncbi:hypothetical protein [Kitasatospora sp. NPDC094011]|uniref:hypothetical protein n=1 Tax=Kitasatospora sp. NPDC094011 TaxID=3364090 RepID=UPI00381F2DE2